MRAKLGAVLRPNLSAGCSNEEMKRNVDARVAEAQKTDHLLFDALSAAEGREGFLLYGKNWEDVL